MNTDENNDPVWGLLKQRSNPTVSPEFVSRVMDSVRHTAQDEKVVEFPKTAQRLWIRMAGTAAAVALIAGIYLSMRPDSGPQLVDARPAPNPTVAVDDSLVAEFTAVQDMHAIISAEDPSELDDSELIALLN